VNSRKKLIKNIILFAGIIIGGTVLVMYIGEKEYERENERRWEELREKELKKADERKALRTIEELTSDFRHAYKIRYNQIKSMTTEDIQGGKSPVEMERDFLRDYAEEMKDIEIDMYVTFFDIKTENGHRIVKLESTVSEMRKESEQRDRTRINQALETLRSNSGYAGFNLSAIAIIEFVFYDDARVIENIKKEDRADIRIVVEKADIVDDVIKVQCKIIELLEYYGGGYPEGESSLNRR
jgi:hypothetical protein